ncbi:MAG: recombinase family protein [Lachnospiraceae bacterium]|nr:recombinase family protein [Lachnospiraceae bacterium]
MARKVRNYPVPRGKMQENKILEQAAKVKTQEFSVGLYIRLSKEDGGKNNQNTVENQKKLLEDHVKDKPDMKVYEVYVDNGFSGTNFERPAFKRMMEDAKRGRINCIIVKDLSRFGRSYLETGNYLEKIFPFLKIRFISVTDHLDTFAALAEKGGTLPGGVEIPLKNIINEVYAKDISRKVGSAIEMKKKEGKYGGGVAPYGYMKSNVVNGRYEIDGEAAEVVRYIFELRSQGYGYCSIVKILNEKGIKSPSAYRYEKGIVKNERMQGILWKIYAIEDMLRDEVYLGNMVRGKTHSAMYRGEKRHRVPRSEWTIVEGTHEPIISKELFDAVQAINERKTQEHRERLEKAMEHPKRDNLLKGKIFCGDCGITMGYTANRQNSGSYYCPNYKENGAMGCVKKRISIKKLEKALAEAIQTHLRLFTENKAAIQLRNGDAETEKRRKALEQEIAELKKEEMQYRQKISGIYLDYKEKLLSVQEYFMLKAKYQAVLAELESDRKRKEQVLNEVRKEYRDNMELAHAAEQYIGQVKVSQEMVDALIERVEVYEKGRIHIVFRFADEYLQIQCLRTQSLVNIERETDLRQEAGE